MERNPEADSADFDDTLTTQFDDVLRKCLAHVPMNARELCHVTYSTGMIAEVAGELCVM